MSLNSASPSSSQSFSRWSMISRRLRQKRHRLAMFGLKRARWCQNGPCEVMNPIDIAIDCQVDGWLHSQVQASGFVRKKAQLDGLFYRKLARLLSSIPYLAVWIERREGLDMEFVLKFKGLVKLTLFEYELDDQLLHWLFDHFESFEVNYTIEEDEVMIRRAKKALNSSLASSFQII